MKSEFHCFAYNLDAFHMLQLLILVAAIPFKYTLTLVLWYAYYTCITKMNSYMYMIVSYSECCLAIIVSVCVCVCVMLTSWYNSKGKLALWKGCL